MSIHSRKLTRPSPDVYIPIRHVGPQEHVSTHHMHVITQTTTRLNPQIEARVEEKK